MSIATQLRGNKLLGVLWFGVLMIGVVVLTAFIVNTGFYAVATVIPFIGAITLPWHLRLSFIFSVIFFQSAFIVPFVPGPVYMWMAACIPAWTGVVLAVIFKQIPFDLNANIRRNWPIFVGIIAYCLNLFIILQIRGFGFRIFGGGDTMGGKVPLEQFLCSIIPLAFLIVQTNRKEFVLLYKLQLILSCSYLISEWVVQWAPGQAFYLLYVLALSSDMASFVGFEHILFSRYQSLKIAAPALLFLVIIYNGTKRFKSARGLILVPLSIGLLGLSLLSGHREALVFTAFIMTVYLWAARFFSFKTLLAIAVLIIIAYVGLLLTANYLPLSMQRAVSFIPGLNIQSVAAVNASETVILRWELTKYGWSQLSEYALVGRGFVVLPSPTPLDLQSLLWKHVWTGHFYNGTIGLLVHTGILGTISALFIYGGGIVLALRVIRKIRDIGGENSMFNRASLLIASYCIAKPVYFLIVNGNAKVALQEFMIPIALLLVCERLLLTDNSHYRQAR